MARRSLLQRAADRARRSAVAGNAVPRAVRWTLRGSEPPQWAVDHLYRSGGTVSAVAPDGTEILLECRGDEFEPSQVFWRGLGGHQPEALLFWAFARDAGAVLDVGAHLGIFSMLAAIANPGARVVAMEPMPDVAARLLANLQLNGLSNVTLVTGAASSVDGVRDLHYVPGVAAPSSSGLEGEFFRDFETATVSVPAFRVESLAAAMTPPMDGVDLVKIDVESHEPEVLEGMGELLASSPSIFVEVLARTGTAASVEAAVEGRGYRFLEFRPDGVRETAHLGGNPEIRNYLLTTLSPDQVDAYWSAAHPA